MRIRIHSLAFALVAALPAMAQSTSFGLFAGLASPSGSMSQANRPAVTDSALAIGVQYEVRLGNGGALVPRLDWVRFNGDYSSGPLGVDGHVTKTLMSMGADYEWYVSRNAGEGLYLSTGAGFLRMEEEFLAATNYYYSAGSDHMNRLYVALGLGGRASKAVEVSARLMVFGDARLDDYNRKFAGQSLGNHALSKVFTLGATYHF